MVTELFDLSDCGPRDYVYTHTHLDALGNEYEHTHASLLDSDTDLYRYLHSSPANGYPCSADEYARTANSNSDTYSGKRPLHEPRP